MNSKGFTLIELLATIVLLALIGGTTTYGILNTLKNSERTSEKIFIDKLSNLIDDYLALNPPTQIVGETYTFDKCRDKDCNESYSVTATKVVKSDNSKIYLNDLVKAGIVNKNDLVNPNNKKKCYINETTNPEIIVYKDSDYVYYYYLDLSGTNTACNITKKNGIINTLPTNLQSKVRLS